MSNRILALSQALAAALLAAGCGGPKPPDKAAPEGVKTEGVKTEGVKTEAVKPVEYFHVDRATAGTLRGKIVFKGARPARQAISMEAEAGCRQGHAGHPVYDEPVVTGRDGGLANAFVYIQAGLEGKNFEPVKEPVNLDQHGCMFVPRVIGIRAAEPLDVKNSDAVSHNIHPMPQNNREWNEQQSPQSPVAEHKFARREIMIPVKCNVHSWMRAYIGVVEHPYFTVTGADGRFEWPNVPPGDYTIAVWHEKLGDQTRQVHVSPATHAEVDFLYK